LYRRWSSEELLSLPVTFLRGGLSVWIQQLHYGVSKWLLSTAHHDVKKFHAKTQSAVRFVRLCVFANFASLREILALLNRTLTEGAVDSLFVYNRWTI
jgi:hypothetical protein